MSLNAYRPGVFAIVAAAALAGLAGCSGGGTGSGTAASASAAGSSGSGGPAAAPATSAPAAPSAGRSPRDVQGGALAALRAAGAVHVTIATKAGRRSIRYSDDSGTDAGRQVITISDGEHATVLLIDGVGYAKGNEAALAGFFGFAPAEAAALAGRWISFHPGDTAGGTNYSSIVNGITLASVADELRLSGSLTLSGPARAGSGAVVCVHGNPVTADAPAGAKAALCVAASGPPRPVSYLGSASGVRQTTSFSRWGEPLHLTAPPNPIAASSIGTGTA